MSNVLFYHLLEIYFEFYHCAFVVVKIAIVRGWKYCYYCWELLCSSPMIHFESIWLSFVCSNYWKQSVFLQKSFRKFIAKEIRAPSGLVFLDDTFQLARIIINRISPHQITKRPILGNFFKSFYFFNIVNLNKKVVTFFISGDIPPWMHKNLLLTRADNGKASNKSIINS